MQAPLTFQSEQLRFGCRSKKNGHIARLSVGLEKTPDRFALSPDCEESNRHQGVVCGVHRMRLLTSIGRRLSHHQVIEPPDTKPTPKELPTLAR